MSFADRYRQFVSILVAVLLGSITAWAIRIGSSPSLVVLLGLSTVFFIGQAVPAVVDRVPHYHSTGSFVLGLIATGILLLDHRSGLAIGTAVIGMGHGVDLLLHRYDIISSS